MLSVQQEDKTIDERITGCLIRKYYVGELRAVVEMKNRRRVTISKEQNFYHLEQMERVWQSQRKEIFEINLRKSSIHPIVFFNVSLFTDRPSNRANQHFINISYNYDYLPLLLPTSPSLLTFEDTETEHPPTLFQILIFRKVKSSFTVFLPGLAHHLQIRQLTISWSSVLKEGGEVSYCYLYKSNVWKRWLYREFEIYPLSFKYNLLHWTIILSQ